MFFLRVLGILIIAFTMCVSFDKDSYEFDTKKVGYTMIAIIVLFALLYLWFHPLVGIINIISVAGVIFISKNKLYNVEDIKDLALGYKLLFYGFLASYSICTVITIIEVVFGHRKI